MTAPANPILNQSEEKWFNADSRFDKLYPLHIRQLGYRHWTSLEVAEEAARFLATGKGARILDIGSGVGKFCLAAAHYQPTAFYFGIEQRKDLVDYAETARNTLGLQNVSFIHGNFTDIDFKQYDHFYFYNSFFENIDNSSRIDESVEHTTELFNQYAWQLRKLLEKRPSGTRIATYHSTEDEMPESYHVVGTDMDDQLKFWMKA